MNKVWRMLLNGAISAVAVFFLIVITATFVTFILPESYASTARIMVRRASEESRTAPVAYDPYFLQTQIELLASEQVLSEVVEPLDLRSAWAKRFGIEGKLKTWEVLTLLKRRLDVRQVRNTTLIEIRVFSEEREDPARIANKIAEAYQSLGQSQSPKIDVTIVDRALPGLRPVRPNKPLNIVIGVILGAIAGMLVGGLVFLFQWLRSERKTRAANLERN